MSFSRNFLIVLNCAPAPLPLQAARRDGGEVRRGVPGGEGGRGRPAGGRQEEHGQGDAARLRQRRERQDRLHLVDLLLQPAGAGGRERGADRGLRDDTHTTSPLTYHFLTLSFSCATYEPQIIHKIRRYFGPLLLQQGRHICMPP